MKEEQQNKTKTDAWTRLLASRTGSFRNATLEYLEGLREYVQAWLRDIEDEIANLQQKQKEVEESETESYRVDRIAEDECSECPVDDDEPTRRYFVGIGGSPRDSWEECGDFVDALDTCWCMAYEMAERESVDKDTLDVWGEDDPDIGAGVCPEGDTGGYWPNIFIEDTSQTCIAEDDDQPCRTCEHDRECGGACGDYEDCPPD